MLRKTIRRLLIYSFLSIPFFQLNAQNSKDYIVTHAGDTILGTIREDSNDNKTGRKIKFEDSKGSKTTYRPGDIKGFKVLGQYYESIKAEKKDGLIGLPYEGSVFAKRMVDGFMSLYKYNYSEVTYGGYSFGGSFPGPSRYMEDNTDFYITIDNEKPVQINLTSLQSGNHIFFTDFPEIHEKMISDKAFTINLAVHEHNKRLKQLVPSSIPNKFIKKGKVSVILVRKPSYMFNGDLKVKLDNANISTLKENQFLNLTLPANAYHDMKLTGKRIKKSVSFYGRTDNVIFLEFATGDISTILPITMEKALQYMESAEEIMIDLSLNN